MKVDFSANINMYKKNQPGAKVRDEAKSAPAAKTDVAEFSHGSTAVSDKKLSGVKVSVMQDVNRPADPERLEQLAQEIKNNTYRVPTDKIASAILDVDA